jgi:CMP/dCMP kinase
VSSLIIAIDGPSGSGKSSTSRTVAMRLGLRYVDTGAMYRAMTWWMLHHGIDVDDASVIAARSGEALITVNDDPRDPRVFADGIDISGPIREAPVADAVSKVAAVPAIRVRMVEQQRRLVRDALAAGTGAVVEGRDIGTVVLPDADLKVYLTADVHERAARRARESVDPGATADISRAHENLASRDSLDSTRAVSPLLKAEDAVLVDGTDMSLDEVADAVIAALPPQ